MNYTPSYVPLSWAETDLLSAKDLNHMETMAACIAADILSHDHEDEYPLKADADEDYWHAANGGADSGWDADTLQGSHAAALLGTAPGLPIGTVAGWDGELAAIPSGWYLCDGTNGTYDLRGRFLICTSATIAIGTSVGANGVTPEGVITVQPTVLTESQIPSHNHYYEDGVWADDATGSLWSATEGIVHLADPNFIQRTGLYTGYEGSSYGHIHTATWEADPIDNRPPYRVIYWIERRA